MFSMNTMFNRKIQSNNSSSLCFNRNFCSEINRSTSPVGLRSSALEMSRRSVFGCPLSLIAMVLSGSEFDFVRDVYMYNTSMVHLFIILCVRYMYIVGKSYISLSTHKVHVQYT
jgi:hypothetical protein